MRGLWSITGTKTVGLLPITDASIRPVVVHVNDYSIGLYNGDDGVVLAQGIFSIGEKFVK